MRADAKAPMDMNADLRCVCRILAMLLELSPAGWALDWQATGVLVDELTDIAKAEANGESVLAAFQLQGDALCVPLEESKWPLLAMLAHAAPGALHSGLPPTPLHADASQTLTMCTLCGLIRIPSLMVSGASPMQHLVHSPKTSGSE